MPVRAVISVFVLLAGLAPVRAAACPPDVARFTAYFAGRVGEDTNFFVIDDPVRRLAYLGAAAQDALPALHELATEARWPTPYLALWAIARIAPEDPAVAAARDDAIQAADSRVFYEQVLAGAFLARAGGDVSERQIARFVPPLFAELDRLDAEPGEVFRRAMIAWALYEIGTDEAIARADAVTQAFIDEPYPEGTPLSGIDAFEIIGPHARAAAPLLMEILAGEYDVASRLSRDEAARALTIVDGEGAQEAVTQYLTEARAELGEAPSLASQAIDALLDLSADRRLARDIDELIDLLPYSYCAQPEVEAILETDSRGAEAHLEAAEFLILSGADPGELLRARLAEIESRAEEEDLRERAAELRGRL